MHGRWQLQEAKQRFSELIRSVEADGPQVVTRHGEDVAVVISIAEYRHLRHEGENFKAFLQSAPDLDLEISDRSRLRDLSAWARRSELPS